MRTLRPRAGLTQGLTLIELMVSMAIMSIVLVGALMMLRENQRQYLAHGDIAAIQSSLRVAATQIERSLSRAGYGIDANYALEPVVMNGVTDTGTLRDAI